MKNTTLALYIAAGAVGGALLPRWLFRSVTINPGSLPKCPGELYTADSSQPSGWRCTKAVN